MKKVLVLVLVAIMAVSCFAFAGCGKTEQKELIVYTESGFPPFEYPDGDQIVGVDMDIAAAIAKELNMKLVIKDVSFDSICAGIQEDNALGLAGITINEERAKTVDFSKTYWTSKQAVIYKTGALMPDANGVISCDVLVGKKVGVQTGTTGDYLVQDVCGEDAPKQYSNAVIAATDIGSGCDYVVIDNIVAKNIVAKTTGLSYSDLDAEEEPLGIAVKKGNTELLNKVNTILEKLIADGKIAEFMVKHSK